MADHPRGHEVAVLGGGVLGCAIAYTLARRKLAPIVVDRAGPGGEFPPVELSVWDHTEPAETGRLGLESAGHFPHLDEPERFTALVEDWIATTEPARPDEERLRAAMRLGAA